MEEVYADMTPQIVPIPPEYVDATWPDIYPYINRAMERGNGEMWIEDVYRLLKEAMFQAAMVVMNDQIIAAVVTEVVEYPRKKAVRLILGAGSHLHEWGPLLNDVMEERAKDVGADLIEVQGRMGWMKYLKTLDNYKTRSVMMTRIVG